MNWTLVRIALGGLIVFTLEIRGAESTNDFHAHQIAKCIALPKPSDPPVDDRVFRCVAALADARHAGLDPAEVAVNAVALAGLPQVLGRLTQEAILRSLKTAEDMECLDPEGLAAMRKGEPPSIRHKSHAGDQLKVNPIIPREYGAHLHNLMANLGLPPAKIIATGGPKIGARHLHMAREFSRAGLLTSRDGLSLEERVQPERH